MSEFDHVPAISVETSSVKKCGSIENGISGNYEFSIRAILSEAWEKTKGSKGTVWLAVLFYILFSIPISFALPFLLSFIGLTEEASVGVMLLTAIVTQILSLLLIMPVAIGMFMIGVKRAVGAPAAATDIFRHYNKAFTLLGTAVLMYVMIILGTLLLIIPGIYLSVAYGLALPLVIEKGLSPWQALETSRKAVGHRWFRFVGLYIALMLISLVAMLPLGIGLIWVLPMMIVAGGIAYRNVFGVETAAMVD